MNKELPNDDPITVEIDLPPNTPNILCNDNMESNTQTSKRKNESDVSGPQSNNESQGQEDKRNLQKKPWVNYKYLHNGMRFPDEEDDLTNTLTTAKVIYATMCDTPLRGDEPKTIQQAKTLTWVAQMEKSGWVQARTTHKDGNLGAHW